MKKIYVITLFPEYFAPLLNCGVVGQALRGERGAGFELVLINPRDFVAAKYKAVDDTPYGGGPGMIMRADILENALLSIGRSLEELNVVYTSARGSVWNNVAAKKLAQDYLVQSSIKDLVFVCGRYEGIDERFLQKYVNLEISLGDYIVSGGEIAVLAILDSALRFCPDVLGHIDGASDESFEQGGLEAPQYTKPFDFGGMQVPEVLMSGHHKNILQWKKDQSALITKTYRPDLC
jgi:tRNA (guanine37-N1)-methyltransferase